MRSPGPILLVMLSLTVSVSLGSRQATPVATSTDSGRCVAPEALKLLGEQRVAALQAAVDEAELVVLPFADRRLLLGQRAQTAGYRFQALGPQRLEVRLDRQPLAHEVFGDGAVAVDLLQVAGRGMEVGPVRILDFEIGMDGLYFALPAAGEYVLRLAPDLLVATEVAVRLELGAVLPFPVAAHGPDAIRSFYGDSRAGGTRRHEGVDIYAPRSTPIIAVADGRAVPGRDRLGGRVVRLNTPGVTFYYAHLERAAMTGPVQVAAGEVVGYIGNTGNAARTPPHLHFGIFRWGTGALDPLPLLRERRFDPDSPPAVDDAGAILVGAGDSPQPASLAASTQRLIEVEGRLLWLPPGPVGSPPLRSIQPPPLQSKRSPATALTLSEPAARPGGRSEALPGALAGVLAEAVPEAVPKVLPEVLPEVLPKVLREEQPEVQPAGPPTLSLLRAADAAATETVRHSAPFGSRQH